MTVWLIAGLLGMATGVRIGWALVNKQSLVSTAMIIALGSLALVAALNWEPLTLLLDTALRWPNISVGLSQVALVACAAGSCVMITSAASVRRPVVVRRIATAQYGLAIIIGVVALVLFLMSPQQPEMSPREYLTRTSQLSLPWLLPLLYVLLALTLVSWAGLRHSNRSRRGRALFVFTLGIVLILLASAFFFIQALSTTHLVGVGTAVTLLGTAMAVVAAGSLLPTIEDWFTGRRELRLIEPLLTELERRQPDIGIGVRPRGPLVFRVAERLSLISDALFLEATSAPGMQRHAHAVAAASELEMPSDAPRPGERSDVAPQAQARLIAEWINGGTDGGHEFPGVELLRQPDSYSDREWIIEIARQYREVTRQSG